MKAKKGDSQTSNQEQFLAEYDISPKKWAIAVKAADLFFKNGYVQTSVREIAQACDINPGTLYYYFQNKDDILSLILDQMHFDNRKAMKIMPGLLEEVGPEETMKRAIKLSFKHVSNAPEKWTFWYREYKNLSPEMLRSVNAIGTEVDDVYEVIIRKGCEKGIFKVPDARIAACNVSMMIEMWALRLYEFNEKQSRKKFLNAQIEMIFHALGHFKYKPE